MSVDQAREILWNVMRLGHDLDAHKGEIIADPDNYDAVCDHIASEIDRYAEMLVGTA